MHPYNKQFKSPKLIVFSSLYPSENNPNAGQFIRERIVRLSQRMSVTVVSPQPWSPVDFLIRLFWPKFRISGKKFDTLDGLSVYRPCFFSVPMQLKQFDGFLMALGSYWTIRKLVKFNTNAIVDAHFGYPDGYAATKIARWLSLKSVITLRGSKDKLLLGGGREPMLRVAVISANKVVCVSQELLNTVALPLGVQKDNAICVGNGVDTDKFQPVPIAQARKKLAIDEHTVLIVGVGNLIRLKGFHRVIECLPALLKLEPNLVYGIIGPDIPGDNTRYALLETAKALGVESHIRFFGRIDQGDLKYYFSAAKGLVVTSEYEGWANVILESLASGCPVIASLVGGNAEILTSEKVGTTFPLSSQSGLLHGIEKLLNTHWSRDACRSFALENSWDQRVDTLERLYLGLENLSKITKA